MQVQYKNSKASCPRYGRSSTSSADNASRTWGATNKRQRKEEERRHPFVARRGNPKSNQRISGNAKGIRTLPDGRPTNVPPYGDPIVPAPAGGVDRDRSFTADAAAHVRLRLPAAERNGIQAGRRYLYAEEAGIKSATFGVDARTHHGRLEPTRCQHHRPGA